MPTIGMPKIQIEFRSQGLSAIQRSERGIVLLLLKDDAKVKKENLEKCSLMYTNLADVKEDAVSKENMKYIKLAFESAPNKLLVELYGADRDLATCLNEIKQVKFNYYCAPNATKEDTAKILSWHKDRVKKDDKTIKFVAFNEEADNETIINFTTSSVIYDDENYSGLEFTSHIASALAALPLSRSFTYYVFNKMSYATMDNAEDEDKAVNAGKLFITFDGEKYKIARGVNSLTTYVADKGEDFSKIRVMEAMHLIKDDIRDTFDNYYVGKILNDYQNKQQFIAMINQVYFKELEGEILDSKGNSHVDIDMAQNRMYAVTRGADVDKMKEMDIKTYNTGSNVFLAGKVSLLDAMEDLKIIFKNA